MKAPLGLSRIPLPMLERLLGALQRSRLECPLSEADLIDGGFEPIAADVVAALGGVEEAGVVAALKVTISERVHRPPPRLDLVWAGPETKASVAKNTGMVLEQLFASATRSVIVGGYTFDTPAILKPLHRAMSQRNVSATLFVNIEGHVASPEDVDGFAGAFLDRWLRKVWIFGLPKPDIYYDPRTAIRGDLPGHEWATLHAKCVVVDDERSFVTSANFTDRGQTRNIEAGILIVDKAFSEELAGHWRQLVNEGLVRRYLG